MFTKNKMHMMKAREKCHLFMVLIVEKYMKQRVVVTKTHGSKGMYRKRKRYRLKVTIATVAGV